MNFYFALLTKLTHFILQLQNKQTRYLVAKIELSQKFVITFNIKQSIFTLCELLDPTIVLKLLELFVGVCELMELILFCENSLFCLSSVCCELVVTVASVVI